MASSSVLNLPTARTGPKICYSTLLLDIQGCAAGHPASIRSIPHLGPDSHEREPEYSGGTALALTISMFALMSVKTGNQSAVVALFRKLRILTCRVNKETLAWTLLATKSHLCALSLTTFNISPNLVELSFGHLAKGVSCGWCDLQRLTDQGSTTALLVEAIADHELLGFRNEEGDKLIINRVLNIQTRSCRAILAGIVQNAEASPVCGLFQIRGFEN